MSTDSRYPKVGQHYVFDYAFVHDPRTTMRRLAARHGHTCLVLRMGDDRGMPGWMAGESDVFIVRFTDGFVGSAFSDELVDYLEFDRVQYIGAFPYPGRDKTWRVTAEHRPGLCEVFYTEYDGSAWIGRQADQDNVIAGLYRLENMEGEE